MPARNNPGGGAKQEKVWREAISRAVKRKLAGEGHPQALDRLADALVEAGLEKDVAALREIGDRLDGKPTQQINHADADGGKINVNIIQFSGDDHDS